jgi:hypothetical protein
MWRRKFQGRVSYATSRVSRGRWMLLGIFFGAASSAIYARADCIDYSQYIRFAGSGDEDAEAYGVAVNAEHVYVTDYNRNFLVFDASDPTAPTMAGRLTLSDNAFRVAVAGEYAFVANRNLGLLVVDVSDPAHPVAAGSVDTPGAAFGVDVAGTIACVGDGDLQVIDVTEVSHPQLLATLVTAGWAQGVAISGTTALVADWDALIVVDIATPTLPVVMGSVPLSGAMDVAVDGDIAYVSAQDYGLYVVSLADPGAPAVIAQMLTLRGPWASWPGGDYLYVADGHAGLEIIDVADPSAPVVVGTMDTPGAAWDVAVTGDYAYVADDDGLRVIQIDRHVSAPLVGSVETFGAAQDAALTGSYALVAESWGFNGFEVVDVSDPAAPVVVHRVSTEASAYAVEIRDPFAFVGASDAGLLVFDISTPTAPTQIGAVNTWPEAMWLAVSGELACVASEWDSEVDIIDVGDPPHPTVTALMGLPSGVCGMALAGTHAYFSVANDTLMVVDLANPAVPQFVARVDCDRGTVGIDGALLVVAGNTLSVFDVTDPASPQMVSNTPIPQYGRDLQVEGGFAYWTNYLGLFVADLHDPVHPTFLGCVSSPGEPRGLAVEDDFVLVASTDRGLELAWRQCETSAVSDPSPWPPMPCPQPLRLPRLSCSPSPAREDVVVRFDVPAAGRVSLGVFDPSGRRVCKILDAGMPAGTHTAAWDGRDAWGRPAPSGMYEIVLAASGRVVHTQAVVVR